MNMVDRPWPENHEYKSKKYILDFIWGNGASQIPHTGRVEFENGEIHQFSPSASPWSTIEEARKDVMRQAEKYIEKHFS